MKLIITMPAYNEGKTIGGVVKDIKSVMDKKSFNYEILVLNDGSTDNTANAAKTAGAIVYSHQTNKGLAKSFNSEIKYCLERKADIIIHTDADGQYLAKDILKLINKCKEGYDFVLGSRFLGVIEYMPWLKRIGNKAFSKVISYITKTNVSDGQSGFRLFSKEIAKNINIISNYTYTQEQVLKVLLDGKYKYAEVPVYFAKRADKSRLMKNPFHYAAKALINLLRVYRDYEPLKFFCSIGLLSLLIGFISGFYLIYLHITTGIIGHIPMIIFTALTIITGLQIILFGFLADMFKKI